ncbi:MAG: ATP-binding cassette domain-containing protein [Nanoarchaeota archaeon]|nr:ATP-binding cassette domain-containing protein [Nanoarchaeota archaeon]
MAYISIKKLTKRFGNFTAVDNFSLDINKGDIIGIVGPNGAGKTTLVSMLTTRLFSTSGKAILAGFDISQNPNDIRKIIGVVFQESVIDEEMDPYNNLDYQGMLYKIPKEKRKRRITRLLDLVGLSEVVKKEVAKLSGGMKRRVEIARGLMNHPDILFLDEPTLGLDPISRNSIWSYIKKLNRDHKTTTIITTNYMQEADELCNKIAIINKGKLITTGPLNKLKDSLKGDIIDIRINSSRAEKKAEEIFRRLRWVRQAEAYDSTLRIFVTKSEQKIEKVIELLKKNKIGIKSITLKKPSLDDVFLHYCGEELK